MGIRTGGSLVMIKGKSKFDFEIYCEHQEDWMGFNKQKYTKEQAVEKWKEERCINDEDVNLIIEDAFVRYRVGRNEDNEPCAGWWLEWKDYGSKSVPAWLIRRAMPWEDES